MSQITKKCKECAEGFVVESQFPHKTFCSLKCKRKRNNRDGRPAQREWAKAHPERFAQYSKKYRAKNPEKHRAYNRSRLYNLSIERFEERLSYQGGNCLVCCLPLGSDMVVDHDHKCCPGDKSCGKCVRGILHHLCNIGIGAFKDNPDICRKAADYLEKFQEKYGESSESITPIESVPDATGFSD